MLNYNNRISVIYTKKLKNETIKSLLNVRSALIGSLNQPIVNEFSGYPDLQWNLNKISQCQRLVFKANLKAKISINLLDFGKIYKLIRGIPVVSVMA